MIAAPRLGILVSIEDMAVQINIPKVHTKGVQFAPLRLWPVCFIGETLPRCRIYRLRKQLSRPHRDGLLSWKHHPLTDLSTATVDLATSFAAKVLFAESL